MASKNREAHSRKRKGDAFKEGQPSELELDKLAGKIGTKWKTLGLHLGISQDVLEGIEANEKDKPYEMLLHWRKTTDSAAPYGDLYHALCDDRVGLNNVAKEFCCVEMTAARKTVSKRGTEKMNKGEEEPLTEAGGEASAEKKYEEDKENTGKAAEYCEFIETKNTTEKTKSDLNVWERLCKQKSESRKLEAIPWDELNLLLCAFFKDIKKKNGDEYEPGTITCPQRSIQRHLNTHGSQANLIHGNEFKLSREVLSPKRKQLVVEKGKGNRPRASTEISSVEEDKMFVEGGFGEHDPVALQCTVWWLLGLHFGFRTSDQSRRLQWGDITLQNDPDTGNEMLVWQAEGGSKTRQGQDKASGHRAFYLTAQATDNERCPVKYYKMFRSHRPMEMNKPDTPFYLAINHQRKATASVWYKRSPLGKNEIGKLLTKAAQKAGLPGRVTNHSVRKTCRLLDSDVPQNLKILDSYKSASISPTTTTCKLQAVVNSKEMTQMESMTAIKEAQPGVFQGANFQNCSFNIQLMNQPSLRNDEDD